MNRKEKLRVLLTSGYTLKECGEELGISPQRVSQLRIKWFPYLSHEEYGAGKRALDKLKDKLLGQQWKTNRNNWKWEDELLKAKHDYFRRKKQNEKKGKWEWLIDFDDVVWNDVCPILGVPIDWTSDVRCDASPSLDRRDSKLGYIPGNVELISWRANRIKNDGTAEEHLKIANYMMSQSF